MKITKTENQIFYEYCAKWGIPHRNAEWLRYEIRHTFSYQLYRITSRAKEFFQNIFGAE